MISIQLPDAGTVNLDLLDEELKAALGEVCAGASTQHHNGRILLTVHLLDTATDNDIRQARKLVNAHDPDKRSARQIETQRVLDALAAAKADKDKSMQHMNTYLTLQIAAMRLGLVKDE